MRYLEGDAVASILKGMISAKRQQHHYETDLTANSIYRLTGPGAVDFGGSEELPAPSEKITPEKTSAEDSYGWWDLAPGTYILRYNEVAALAALLARLDLRPVDEQIATLATALGAEYGLRAADAIHLTTAVASGADRFITNNADDFPTTISEIDVTYPDQLPELR